MADLSKLKHRRNNLGAPPPLEEASQNFKAPEVAPVLVPEARPPRADVTPLWNPEKAEKGQDTANHERVRIDGRSLRKSRRLVPFANRVTEEFDQKLRSIAQRDGLKLVEVLERGIEAYEATRKQEIAAR
jgi:hypothetical protein